MSNIISRKRLECVACPHVPALSPPPQGARLAPQTHHLSSRWQGTISYASVCRADTIRHGTLHALSQDRPTQPQPATPGKVQRMPRMVKRQARIRRGHDWFLFQNDRYWECLALACSRRTPPVRRLRNRAHDTFTCRDIHPPACRRNRIHSTGRRSALLQATREACRAVCLMELFVASSTASAGRPFLVLSYLDGPASHAQWLQGVLIGGLAMPHRFWRVTAHSSRFC